MDEFNISLTDVEWNQLYGLLEGTGLLDKVWNNHNYALTLTATFKTWLAIGYMLRGTNPESSIVRKLVDARILEGRGEAETCHCTMETIMCRGCQCGGN